jgi:undecaprenyl-diphosphatase
MLFRALNLAGTNDVLDRIMVFITVVSGVYIIALVAVPVWLRGRRDVAFDLLLLLGITILVTQVIKLAVDRPRPCQILLDARTLKGYGCDVEPDPGFPSGHASRAFVIASFLAIRFRWRVGAPAAVLAGLVGLSRIYLGVHWPSDILGGALLGIALAVAFDLVSRRVALYQRIRTRIVEAIPHWPRRSS